MATVEQPITRSELRAELQVLRNEFRDHYATKADLYRSMVQLGLFLTGIVSAAVAFLKLTGG